MPLKSKAQQRYLYKFHPSVAREFAHKTPNMKGLPEHVKGSKSARKATGRKK